MNIMYAADDNYAEIMGVSIMSLIMNNRDSELHFYLVEDRISQQNIDYLTKIIVENNADVTFISKPDIRGMLGVDLKTLRWSDSAYSRLFLKELFGEKKEIDKVLYLDCDVLVVDSLKELWEEDITDYLGAACLECMSNMHKRIVGAKKTDNYVNSGMLLLNVNKWIEENIDIVASDFIKRYKGKTEYVDQGVINGTISNRLKIVNPRYNLTALAYDFTYEEMQIYRKPEFGYSKEVWEEAVDNPAIVHFTTSFLSIRPWFEGSKHPFAKEWKRIHEITPWKEHSYRILETREKKEKRECLYNKIPRWLAIRVAGILHAYVKPIIYVIK